MFVLGIGIVHFRPKAVSGFENPRIVGLDGGSVLSASLTVSFSLSAKGSKVGNANAFMKFLENGQRDGLRGAALN